MGYNKFTLGFCLFFAVFLVLVGFAVVRSHNNTTDIMDSCTKTDLMVMTSKSGWRHIYDCSKEQS